MTNIVKYAGKYLITIGIIAISIFFNMPTIMDSAEASTVNGGKSNACPNGFYPCGG